MQKDVDQAVAAVAAVAALAAAVPARASLECKDNIADLVNLPSLGRFNFMCPLFLAAMAIRSFMFMS